VPSASDSREARYSVAIYQKSGLRGRAELSAFFLDDILLPERNQRG
jgi:hypothetical protein